MKAFGILITWFLVISSVFAYTSIPTTDTFDIPEEYDDNPYSMLDEIMQQILWMTDSSFEKRDQTSTIADLLQSVNQSGIIIDLLHEIAGSQALIDNIANATIDILRNGIHLNSTLKIDINSTELMRRVIKSGVINSTLDVLFFNVPYRNFLSDCLGDMLARNPWVAKLLVELGNGKDLTVPFLANLIENTTSKASNWDQVRNQGKTVKINTRDDNEGTAKEFFQNIVSHVLNSRLAETSIDTILEAVNQSQIVPYLVLQVINDTEIKGMALELVSKVYNSGVLNDIDTNKYYSDAKKENVLSTGVQVALTDPVYAPPLARILQRMELRGIFQQVQWNLYGGPDKS
ncbi:hypothetical protein HYPBUDRAFT_153947 [Hyphopichia burtonii NRRL Y-1933]|uniref:Nucleotide exchange factor SIL1 n=1 Tax=Hyphopichia burtonii NRRL Y-1933 TaxID=984485 RepID=A0A1E4RCQ4_9ASCO|nr:hypothetical protein HYPBUDRAFT_153947 [Hyphopichia burtonii NRRL Y-1933]ODV65044.1 hypothetical protein HYPBUDRAFT_153947 [Hyphopichia burtonii NRRL Y-1933]